MAITGHKTLKEYRRYAGEDPRSDRADSAMRKTIANLLPANQNVFGTGCPARIRTSIDGIRIRSLTFRRRGSEGAQLGGAGGGVKP